MPTYTYRCKNCNVLEIYQSISDTTLTVCPKCDCADFKKVYSAVGVRFNGAGFYTTDSRSNDGKAK